MRALSVSPSNTANAGSSSGQALQFRTQLVAVCALFIIYLELQTARHISQNTQAKRVCADFILERAACSTPAELHAQ